MVSSTSSVEQRADGPTAGERPGTGGNAGPEAAGPASGRRVAVWAVAAVACGVGVLVPALWFGLSGPPRSIVDLPTAGPVVTWSLPLVRLLLDGFAMLTVGALLAGAVLTPATG